MKRGINSKITPDVIEAVFGGELAKKFSRPTLARKVCECRADGEEFTVIGKRYGITPTMCRNMVVRARTLYAVSEIREVEA